MDSNEKLQNDRVKLLNLAKVALFFSSEKNNEALMNLFLATGFKKELPVNLNYMRGLENKKRISEEEEKIFDDLNSKFGLDGKGYFNGLLDTELLDVNELYHLIVLHEQRNYFSMSDDMNNKVQDIINSLDKIQEEPDLTGVDKIAVFGATYQTQKDRLKNGFDFYKRKKGGNNPEKICLLTGYRSMYTSELLQLGIISKDKLEEVKKVGGIKDNDINGFVKFVSENEEYLKYLNRENIVKTLSGLKKSSAKFKDIDFNEDDDIIKLLEIVTSAEEKDLFELARYELEIPDNIVELIFSNDTNGTNILRGEDSKNTLKRANTEDTLFVLYKKYPNFNEFVFVSNGAFVPQQFVSILSVQDDSNNLKVGKMYGKDPKRGNSKTLAATHYAMGPVVAKLLNSREVDFKKHLSGNAVKILKDKSSNEAYEIGRDAVARQH